MPRFGVKVILSDSERAQLLQWKRAYGTPQQVAQRLEIVEHAAEGLQDIQIAEELGINFKTASLWRHRFVEQGLDSLWEIAAGRGRKPQYKARKVKQIVEATLHTKPKGMTHWSCRLMAKTQEVSKATVNRIWQMHHIQPHRQKSFKISRDRRFLEKLTDVVGVYLNPPQKAVVLCVDEKSQIQALDRTQPGLPLKRGRCGTFTHDYKRNGTTSLFAALNVLEGKVVGQCYARHRHQEFLKFLRQIDAEFPDERSLHLILDNYGTHKHPKVEQWIAKHPRFVRHFIPTSSSWLNLVERWFGELTQKSVRRGSFASVAELQLAIADFLKAWNQEPKPFIWTASVEAIMEKIEKCRKRLEIIQPGCTQPKRKRKRQK